MSVRVSRTLFASRRRRSTLGNSLRGSLHSRTFLTCKRREKEIHWLHIKTGCRKERWI